MAQHPHLEKSCPGRGTCAKHRGHAPKQRFATNAVKAHGPILRSQKRRHTKQHRMTSMVDLWVQSRHQVAQAEIYTHHDGHIWLRRVRYKGQGKYPFSPSRKHHHRGELSRCCWIYKAGLRTGCVDPEKNQPPEWTSRGEDPGARQVETTVVDPPTCRTGLRAQTYWGSPQTDPFQWAPEYSNR